jgi:hypothetical protein
VHGDYTDASRAAAPQRSPVYNWRAQADPKAVSGRGWRCVRDRRCCVMCSTERSRSRYTGCGWCRAFPAQVRLVTLLNWCCYRCVCHKERVVSLLFALLLTYMWWRRAWCAHWLPPCYLCCMQSLCVRLRRSAAIANGRCSRMRSRLYVVDTPPENEFSTSTLSNASVRALRNASMSSGIPRDLALMPTRS